MTISILEKAQSALVTDNAEGIRATTGQLVELVEHRKAKYLGPLLVMIDALAKHDIAAAVEIALVTANAPENSALKQPALASVLKHADTLAEKDVAAAVNAACKVLFLADSMVYCTDAERLNGTAAARVLLGSALKLQAVESILKHVDALAEKDIDAAINAAWNAAFRGTPGTELEKQAVASWAKHIDTVAGWDVAWVVNRAFDATGVLGQGSALEKQAAANILKHLDALAEQDVVAAVKVAHNFMYRTSYHGDPLQLQVIAKILKHVDALAEKDVAAAVSAADSASGCVPDSALGKQAIASVLKHLDALAEKDVAKAVDFARLAMLHAPLGSAHEKQAVASLLKHFGVLAEQDAVAAGRAVDAVRKVVKHSEPRGAYRQKAERMLSLMSGLMTQHQEGLPSQPTAAFAKSGPQGAPAPGA
jgi:hypothetical protein